MLEAERAKGPVVVVDGGGSLAPRARFAPDELPQRRLKAELIAKGWATGGLDAVALASSDWALGSDTIFGLAKEHGLPVLAANLVCDGEKPFPGAKLVERDGLKVGLVGITTGPVEGCEVGEALPAVREALAQLGEVDVAIGLFPLNGTELSALAGAELGVDLIVDGSGKQSESADPVGAAWSLSAGTRAKHVGIARVAFVPGAEGFVAGDREQALVAEVTRLEERVAAAKKRVETADEGRRARLQKQLESYEGQLTKAREGLSAWKADPGPTRNTVEVRLVALDATIADHAATKAMVDQAKAAMTRLEAAGEVVPVVARVTPAGSPFAGSDGCAGCHPAQQAQWQATPHAHAWQSLITAGSAMDRECFGCHVTGHGQAGGPSAPAQVAGLRDVQCEACHGPAAAHVANPTVDLVKTPGVEVCTGCHDGERDMGRFDHGSYLPKVQH